MTTLFTYNFETGLADGTAMTISNSLFTNYIQGPWTFSSAHVLTQVGGLLAGRVAPVAQAAYGNNADTPHAWASTTTTYYRFYVYIEQMPSANTTLLNLRNGSGGPTTALTETRILTSGAVQIRNINNVQVAVSSAGLVAAGEFVRFEGFLDSANNKQQVKVFVGANVNGSTPDYDSGLVTSDCTSLATNCFQMGVINSATAILHFDNLVFQDSGWVGSALQQIPPTCSAGADQTAVEPWSTVTLTGTDSDSDGTIVSRIWTQLSGKTVTLNNATTATVTYTAPPTLNGDTAQFRYQVTDNSGAATAATVNVTTMPVTERAVINGVEVPALLKHVTA